MRKWIVADNDKLKLVASFQQPGNAICEAPESFTDEMEPYFEIIETGAPGPLGTQVRLNPAFFEKKKEKEEAFLVLQKKQHEAILRAHKRTRFIQDYNAAHPLHRLIKNILGEHTKHPKMQKALRLLFSGKVDF